MINSKRGNKKGQEVFGMPYSVIFSILLIVFFIAAAWIAIRYFWCPWTGCPCTLSDQSQEGFLKDGLQGAIEDVWHSEGSDRNFTINLPPKIEKICFFDFNAAAVGPDSQIARDLKRAGSGNLYLYPIGDACSGFRVMTLSHVNITKTTASANPLCFDNGNDLWIDNNRGSIVRIYKK